MIVEIIKGKINLKKTTKFHRIHLPFMFDSSIYRGYFQKVLKKSQTTIINLEDPNLKFRHITHSA